MPLPIRGIYPPIHQPRKRWLSRYIFPEYQAQQINFERLQLASKLEDASNEYQDAISNRTMVFSFNSGDGTQKVDITYNNYKNYMNII